MATDAAKSNLSASILFDEIKSRLSGTLDYVPADNSEKWIYKKITVGSTPSSLFNSNDEFLGNINSADSLTNDDKVLWLAMKHSGVSGINSAKTKEGVMVNYAGSSKPPLYNGTSGNNQNNIFLIPDELYIAKFNGVTISDLQAGTCRLTNYKPSAVGLSNVLIHVAALIDGV